MLQRGELCLLNLYTFALLRIVPKRTISSTIQEKFLSVIEHTNDHSLGLSGCQWQNRSLCFLKSPSWQLAICVDL